MKIIFLDYHFTEMYTLKNLMQLALDSYLVEAVAQQYISKFLMLLVVVPIRSATCFLFLLLKIVLFLFFLFATTYLISN